MDCRAANWTEGSGEPFAPLHAAVLASVSLAWWGSLAEDEEGVASDEAMEDEEIWC